MASLSRVFCCFSKNRSENIKVDLIPELEAKILEETKKIITNKTYICPLGLKNHLIKKYTYEPGRISKVISKMSKPAAKIIATFAVASILTPIACAYIIPSSIPVLPGLIVLGSEYWASVSVSLVSLAVYPLITAAFKVVFNGVSCASHFVARRVHLLVQRLGFFKGNNLHVRASFENLMSEIHYDHNTSRFYSSIDGVRKQLRGNHVKACIEHSLQLERYEILLEGRRDKIVRYFSTRHKNKNQDIKSLVNSIMSGSDLPYPAIQPDTLNINTISDLPEPTNDEEERAYKLASHNLNILNSFDDMINNSPQQYCWQTFVSYYLVEQVQEEAEKIFQEMRKSSQAAQSSSPI